MPGPKITAALAFAFVAGLAALAFPPVLTTDIADFIPDDASEGLAEFSQDLTRSELTRAITLVIRADGDAQTTEATREIAEALAHIPEVEWVRSGPDEAIEEAFYNAYFERRFGLAYGADLSEDGLRQRARRLRGQLAAPTGTFLRQIAARDPLLLFYDHVSKLRSSGRLEIRDNVFVTSGDEVRGVIFLASRASPLDGAATRRLQSAIDAAMYEAGVQYEQGGIHPIALDSERRVRGDITRVSVIGTLAVVVLILWLFRSFGALFAASVPIAGGMIVALSVTQLVFGRIHGLTLAFGATLIGVSLDYVVHYMNHHVLLPGETPRQSLRPVRAGLLLGAATTIVGLAALAWTSFTGIRQMAVFTSVGVAAALALTFFVLPAFLPAAPRVRPFHRRAAERAGALLSRLRGARRKLLLAPLAALVLAAVGLPQLKWNDDLRSLSPIDPELQAVDERVREAVAPYDAGRLAFVAAPDLGGALRRSDALAVALDAAVRAGELEAHRSLRLLLPSAETQEASHAALNEAAPHLNASYAAEGFAEGVFTPFLEALNEPFEPLRRSDLEGTPIERLMATHFLETEDQVRILTFVRGVQDEDALRTRIEAVEGARYFDQRTYLQSAYGQFRTRTLELVLVGLIAVFLLVLVRYRSLRRSLAAFLPAALAAAASLGTFGLLGIEANLLNVVCLLLVLSMGVDYGVFIVEAAGRSLDEGGATLVSLAIACTSTFASFGVLALSESPALVAMGLTASLGVLFSLILAPTAWALLEE
ncbi:MAG: hypothetical protein AAF938_02990 [Myxococcota bacterium]